MDRPLFISVLIPCYNEEIYIQALCEDIISQQWSKDYLEVFFIDGGSTDKTRDILHGWMSEYPFFKLIENTDRYVPFALNLGIKAAVGDVIIRLDAHARYPSHYFSVLTQKLTELGADNVGGCWETRPSGEGLLPLAIARAMSSVFGVGNALYRLQSDAVQQVDTVPFGCYPRSVFEQYGLFDEEMIRNQDDEFNGRLIKNGGRIFLIPQVRIIYFARKTMLKAVRMFYQYGLFKPLVNRKLGSPATLRQFVPPVFLASLLFSAVTAFFFGNILWIVLMLLLFHLCTGLVFSMKPVRETKKAGLLWALPVTFLLFHLAYGYGYLAGIIRFTLLRKASLHVKTSR